MPTLLQMKHFSKAVQNSKKFFLNKESTPLGTRMIQYRFHANVECQLSLSGYICQKKIAFTETWRYNTNSPMFWVHLTFEWYKMS